MREDQRAALRQWLLEMAPMPDPAAYDEVEVSAALMLIAHGLMVCFSHCCHPAVRASAVQQVAEGEAELAEVERKYKALMRKRGVVWMEH